VVVLNTLNRIFQQPVPPCRMMELGMVILLPLTHEEGAGE
jgi:hypothetical protein